MAFNGVQIRSTRNGGSPDNGFRDDLQAVDTVGLSLTSTLGVSTFRWELIGRPEGSSAGGAGPEPILLGTASTASFVVDTDAPIRRDGTYVVQCTLNAGTPTETKITALLARSTGIALADGRTLRKLGAFEALQDTSVAGVVQGWATQLNRWFDYVRDVGQVSLFGGYLIQYIHPLGDNANNGLLNSPKKTVSAAYNALATGGTMFIASGVKWSDGTEGLGLTDGQGCKLTVKNVNPPGFMTIKHSNWYGWGGADTIQFGFLGSFLDWGGRGDDYNRLDPGFWHACGGASIHLKDLIFRAGLPMRFGWDYHRTSTGAIAWANITSATRSGGFSTFTVDFPEPFTITQMGRSGNTVTARVTLSAYAPLFPGTAGSWVRINPGAGLGTFGAGDFQISAVSGVSSLVYDITYVEAGADQATTPRTGATASGHWCGPDDFIETQMTNAEWPTTANRVASVTATTITIVDTAGYGSRNATVGATPNVGQYVLQDRQLNYIVSNVRLENVCAQPTGGFATAAFSHGPVIDFGSAISDWVWFDRCVTTGPQFLDGGVLGIRDRDRGTGILFACGKMGASGANIDGQRLADGGIRIWTSPISSWGINVKDTLQDSGTGLVRATVQLVGSTLGSGPGRVKLDSVSSADAADADGGPETVSCDLGNVVAAYALKNPGTVVNAPVPTIASKPWLAGEKTDYSGETSTFERRGLTGIYGDGRLVGRRWDVQAQSGVFQGTGLTNIVSSDVSTWGGGGGITITADTGRDGLNTAHKLAGTGTRYAEATLALAAGDRFLVQFWVRGENATSNAMPPGTGAFFSLGAHLAVFPFTNVPAIGHVYSSFRGVGEWQYVSEVFETTLAGSYTVEVIFAVPTGYDYVVDQFTCVHLPAASVNANQAYQLRELNRPTPDYLTIGSAGTGVGIKLIGHGGLGVDVSVLTPATGDPATITNYEPRYDSDGTTILGYVPLTNVPGVLGGGGGSTYYQTIQNAGTPLAQRADWNASTGLTATDDAGNSRTNVTVNLSTGVAGGQSLIGGTASGDDLTISTTTHGTKGSIIVGSPSTGLRIEETAAAGTGVPQLLIGTAAAVSTAVVTQVSTSQNGAVIARYAQNASAGASAAVNDQFSNGTALMVNQLYGSGYAAGGFAGPGYWMQRLVSGAGHWVFNLEQNSGDYIWLTGAGTVERMRLLNNGNLSLASLNAGGFVTAAAVTGVLGVVSAISGSSVSLNAGQVAHGSAGNTITGENDFFWDATNNRLGILTNVPLAPVDVRGTIAAAKLSNMDQASQNWISLNSNTLMTVNAQGDLVLGTWVTGDPDQSSRERVRITNAGAVQVAALNTGGYVTAAVTTGQLGLVTTIPVADVTGAVPTSRTISTVGPLAGGGNLAGNLTLTTSMATDRLLGRDTAGTGVVEELTVSGGIEFSGSGSIQTGAFTGEVTKAAGGTALTIANDVVTNAKAANMDAARIKGRVTSGTGDPEDLTGAQANTILPVFTDLLKGLVPASGGGTATFLRADGTWVAPPTGGSFYQTVHAAGVALTQRLALNAGVGLTASDDGANNRTQLAVNLSTGVSGGQTLTAGTGSGDDLTISTTSHGTKGSIIVGSSTTGLIIHETVGAGTGVPQLLFGTNSAASTAVVMQVTTNQNGVVIARYVQNTSAGTGAAISDQYQNGTAIFVNQLHGSGFTASGHVTANTWMQRLVLGNGNWLFNLEQNAGDYIFATGTSITERVRIANNGGVSIAGLSGGGYVKAAGGTGLLSVSAAVPYADLSGAPTLYYQTVQAAGADLTQRAKLNFGSGLSASDDGANGRTNVVNTLTAGVAAANQNVLGSTNVGGSLTLLSNNNTSDGKIYFGNGTSNYFDEGTKALNIGGAITFANLNAGGFVKATAGTGLLTRVAGDPSKSFKWSVYTTGFSANGIMSDYQTVVVAADSGAISVSTAGRIDQVAGGSVPTAVASSIDVPLYRVGTTFGGGGRFSVDLHRFSVAGGSGNADLEIGLWMCTSQTSTGTYTKLASFSLSAAAGGPYSGSGSQNFATSVPADALLFVATYRTDTNGTITNVSPVFFTASLELSK